jgi:hypothetical protein
MNLANMNNISIITDDEYNCGVGIIEDDNSSFLNKADQ